MLLTTKQLDSAAKRSGHSSQPVGLLAWHRCPLSARSGPSRTAGGDEHGLPSRVESQACDRWRCNYSVLAGKRFRYRHKTNGTIQVILDRRAVSKQRIALGSGRYVIEHAEPRFRPGGGRRALRAACGRSRSAQSPHPRHTGSPRAFAHPDHRLSNNTQSPPIDHWHRTIAMYRPSPPATSIDWLAGATRCSMTAWGSAWCHGNR